MNKIFTYTAIIFTRKGRKNEGIKVIKLTNQTLRVVGLGLLVLMADDALKLEGPEIEEASRRGWREPSSRGEGHYYNLWEIGGQATR